MEPIKIELQVSLNLSDETKKFFEGVVTGILATTTRTCGCYIPTVQTDIDPIKPAAEPTKPIEPAAEPTKSVVEETKQDKPAAKSVQTEANEISIDDVRKLLASKINDNRPAIKDKLSELGAPSVTKLDPAKYSDFVSFLNSLS
jgi:hypothetical protein